MAEMKEITLKKTPQLTGQLGGKDYIKKFFKTYKKDGDAGARTYLTQLAFKIDGEANGVQITKALGTISFEQGRFLGVQTDGQKTVLWVPKRLGAPLTLATFNSGFVLAVEAFMVYSGAKYVVASIPYLKANVEAIISSPSPVEAVLSNGAVGLLALGSLAVYGALDIAVSIIKSLGESRDAAASEKRRQLAVAMEGAVETALKNTLKDTQKA